MINKLQMKELMSVFFLVVFLGGLSGFMFSRVGLSAVTAIRGSVPLEAEADLADMEGRYVTYEAKYPLGEYLEVTKVTKKYGVTQSSKKDSSAYVVFDEAREVFLSIQVGADRCSEMEAIPDKYQEAIDKGEEDFSGILVSGSLDRLTGEDLEYYIEAMEDAGLSVDEVVYHIADKKIRGNSMSNVYGFTAIGLLMGLMALAILFTVLKDPVKKRVNRYLSAHPNVTLSQLEADFAAARKVDSVWVGQNWTFAANLKEVLFDNREVVWVHSRSERSGRSVSFYVYAELMDGTTRRLSVSSEKNSRQVMELYAGFPHIVRGSNPEYAYLYQHDRDAFLNMKFRGSQE